MRQWVKNKHFIAIFLWVQRVQHSGGHSRGGGVYAGDTLVCADQNGVFDGSEYETMFHSPRLGALHARQASRWVSAGHSICAQSAHYARQMGSQGCGSPCQGDPSRRCDLFAGTCGSTRAKNAMACAEGQITRTDLRLPI
ncbi:hypothetical protein V8C86DRAFT_3253 [Haematococcus lacustris]